MPHLTTRRENIEAKAESTQFSKWILSWKRVVPTWLLEQSFLPLLSFLLFLHPSSVLPSFLPPSFLMSLPPFILSSFPPSLSPSFLPSLLSSSLSPFTHTNDRLKKCLVCCLWISKVTWRGIWCSCGVPNSSLWSSDELPVGNLYLSVLEHGQFEYPFSLI